MGISYLIPLAAQSRTLPSREHASMARVVGGIGDIFDPPACGRPWIVTRVPTAYPASLR
jgi:hypothetical protein